MFGLVLPDLRNICVVPKSNLHPSERLSGRCLNPILSNPAVKSTRSNSKQLGYLNRRIRLHEYNGVPCIICQGKNVPGKAHSVVRRSGQPKNIAFLAISESEYVSLVPSLMKVHRGSEAATADRTLFFSFHVQEKSRIPSQPF